MLEVIYDDDETLIETEIEYIQLSISRTVKGSSNLFETLRVRLIE